MHTLPQLTRRAAILAGGLAVLAGCTSGEDDAMPGMDHGSAHGQASDSGSGAGSDGTSGHGSDHGGAHAGHAMAGGPAPEGIAEAADPTYPVGTEVVLTADHMPGMKGAEATITGAFTTTTYAVSYTPTDGGAPVTDHKWVVHEELENPGAAPLPDGTEVVLLAEHMPGMKGATATIDSSTQETVYMVDVDANGMTMTNHKWVVESEMQPVG